MANQQLPLEVVLAELRSTGRKYRFFINGELRNKNAARAYRKFCGEPTANVDPLTTDNLSANVDEDETDVQDDLGGRDTHELDVKLPSVSRLSWDAAIEAGAIPFDNAAAYMRTYRLVHARHIERLAKQTPVYEWAKQQKGTGPINLGLILGELGDLRLYSNPAKVWKRMGLAVEDGVAARRKKGVQMGYSPTRRTVMHNLGECLLKRNDGVYRKAYDDRKAYELARTPDMPPIAAHKRALRYMEKLWLKHLWIEWRKVLRVEEAA